MKDTETQRRREAISQKIAKEFSVRTLKLAEEFHVSRSVILKDLSALEKEGVLVRVRGGAIFHSTGKEAPFALRKTEHLDIKRRLSKSLIPQIEDGTVIFLSSSTTHLHVISMLERKKDLTIYTNSIEVVNYLRETGHTIVVIGGTYSHKEHCTYGSHVLEMIRDVHFDLSIFGMNGCAGLTGPGTNNKDSQSMGKLIMRRSSRRILVSDQSKLDLTANYQFGLFSDFDMVIMDALTEEHRRKYIEENQGDPKRLLEVIAL
jgi:DeoR/GlpR family transcriptional regulator of sugar metabolism